MLFTVNEKLFLTALMQPLEILENTFVCFLSSCFRAVKGTQIAFVLTIGLLASFAPACAARTLPRALISSVQSPTAQCPAQFLYS